MSMHGKRRSGRIAAVGTALVLGVALLPTQAVAQRSTEESSASAQQETDDPVGAVRAEVTRLLASGDLDTGTGARIEALLASVERGEPAAERLRATAHRADTLAARLHRPAHTSLAGAVDYFAEYLRLRAEFGDDWQCVEFPESQGDHDVDAYYQPAEVDDIVETLAQRDTVTTEVIGTSLRERPIHAVRIGHGDRVVFIQGGIHANEGTGTIATVNLLRDLSDQSPRSRQVREELTIVAVPMLNPDGAVHYQRENDQTWAETVALFPQLGDAPPAFYHSEPGPRFWGDPRVAGYDINRDFNPDFGYVPQAEHLPGSSGARGMYLTAESRASRDLYAALEEEFGLVDVFIDLHNQAPCNTYDHDGDPNTPDRYTPMSISAQMLRDPAAHGAGTIYPHFDADASRRANVAAWETTQHLGAPFANITRYPQNLDLAGSAVSAYQLRGSAGVLMEAGRQRHSSPEWRLEFIVGVHERAIRGILDALTDGTFETIDPDRYHDIPIRH